MSSVVGGSNPISTCAACGKADDNLKSCTACHLVKYCNRKCQISHRPKHKKECRKRAAELKHAGDDNISNSIDNELSEGISSVSISDSVSGSTDKKTSTSYEQNNNYEYDISKVAAISDDELFKDPPPKEECPICMLPMPYASGSCGGVQTQYQTCCGKIVCYGCMVAARKEIVKGNIKRWCPFCRIPISSSNEEYVKRIKKRVELNDAEACEMLGSAYITGNFGLPQDYERAVELFCQGAKFGSYNTHYILGSIVYQGDSSELVEQDMKQAIHHYKVAAIGGHEGARHQLGIIELEYNDNTDEAMKHFIIAARSGFDESLMEVGKGCKAGYVTKDEYAKTLREYQMSLDEMKSEQRTIAARTRREESE